MFDDLPAYPGRGIAIHRHHDGRLEWLYFLTGRSAASRERSLVATADRVTVVPVGAGEQDPLRHYACVRVMGSVIVIGNGDHVDALADAFTSPAQNAEAGDDGEDQRLVEAVARTLEPEPDPPIRTPRIAVVARSRLHSGIHDPGPVHLLAVTAGAAGPVRSVETVELATSEGVLLHTYGGHTTDVTTDAQPHRFDAGGPGTDVAGRLWHALDPELRVAVAVGLVADAVPTRVLTERRIEPSEGP